MIQRRDGEGEKRLLFEAGRRWKMMKRMMKGVVDGSLSVSGVLMFHRVWFVLRVSRQGREWTTK